MSRSVRMVGAALIPAFALPLATGNVARAAVPSPPTNNQLPSQLDIASPYVPQDTCDPQAKPGVLAFARLMASHYREYNYGISRNCTSGITEHSEGRALDWMLNSYDRHERGVADSVLAWLMAPDAQGRQGAMARRFGIMYVIWDRKIWGTYQMDAGWRTYNGPHPHTDHIHFSFSWDGAMQRTSWWTGKAWTGVSTSPSGPSIPLTPPTSYPVLSEGARAPEVELAQKVIGVTADGIFGPATRSALTSWQRSNGVSATGVLDKATWDRMVALGEVPARGGSTTTQDTVRLGSRGESVKALQRILGLSVDGAFGPKTDAAVREFQKSKSLKVNGVVDDNVWKALKGTSYTKTAISKDDSSTKIPATVRRGSTGAAVKELQKVLRIGVDGVFGSQTESAVKSFQRKKSLKTTGVVDSNVWKALKGMSYKKTASSGSSSKGDTSSTKIPATVRRGSRGAAVKQLQKALDLKADGIFGSNTESAVKSFQRSKSLKADGIVGAKTWEALLSRGGGAQSVSPAAFLGSAGVATVATTTEFARLKSMVLSEGARSAGVKKVQQVVGGVAVDGVFGSATAAAVRSFQAAHVLPVTGVVDERTWDALEATKYPFLAYRTTVLKPGSTGYPVQLVQTYLGLKADGTFGTATQDAVRALQGRHGILQPVQHVASVDEIEGLVRKRLASEIVPTNVQVVVVEPLGADGPRRRPDPPSRLSSRGSVWPRTGPTAPPPSRRCGPCRSATG